ncbi:HD domain-containing protein [Candidatus Kaiserbacteria bacterium]|nr:HD domain-containing protein [Candidatus Kaiserbacteria bacterium]
MRYTPEIHRAVRFAIKTHEVYQKQKRKGKDVPYITHPLVVGLIVARAGGSEEEVIAGILHDTIEDSTPAKRVTRTMLEERFGGEVAALVESVTEKDTYSWEERKHAALEHIETFSHGSIMVKSADIIANMAELLDDHATDGTDVWRRFAAPQERVLAHAQQVIAALLARWPESPLADDLAEVSARLRSIESD